MDISEIEKQVEEIIAFNQRQFDKVVEIEQSITLEKRKNESLSEQMIRKAQALQNKMAAREYLKKDHQ